MKTKFITSLIVIALFATSCSKVKDDATSTSYITTAQDEALAESYFEDANQEADVRHETTELTELKSSNETGPTISVDPGENGYADSAWTITVDFGDGIIGRNGWERKGKIHISVYGRYRDQGSHRTVSFENYYVNDYKIEGTHYAENKGFDSTENCYRFEITVQNGKLTSPEGKNITWEATKTRKWVTGYDTKGLTNIYDDEYEITGEAHGVNSDGVQYSKIITEPLHIKVGCPYIQRGKLSIEVEDKSDVLIDYSYSEDTDECNEDAQMHLNGNSYSYKMRRGVR